MTRILGIPFNKKDARRYLPAIMAAMLTLSIGAISLIPRASATTTTVSVDTTLSSITINAGDTLFIQQGKTLTVTNSLTNNGNIINQGQIIGGSGAKFDNYGLILNLQNARFLAPDTFVNHEKGLMKNDSGGYFEGHHILDNYGMVDNYGDIADQDLTFTTYSGGTYSNHAYIENFGGIIKAKGGNITNWGTIHGSFGDRISNEGKGTIENHGTISVGTSFANILGTVNNHAGANLVVFHPTLGPGYLVNNSTLNNFGRYTNTGLTDNFGNFTNFTSALLDNQAGPIPNGEIIYKNYGRLVNSAGATIQNNSNMTKECGATFTNNGVFTGNPIIDNCQYPKVHMSDTTASWGSLLYSGRPFNGEWAKPGSVLIGKQIDSITVQLQKAGAPPGTYTVGVYNANLQLKKAFGIVSTSTLPTTYTDIEFKLPSTDPLYTIQQDDRIGVFYNGGSTSSGVNAMIDRNTADPFDGTNSQRVRYENGGWLYFDTGEDMYMILKQTHG